VAATARGEAEKILKVKQAEAEAEAKALQGQGIANQRKAIIEGFGGIIREGGGGLHFKRRDHAGAGHAIISTDERNRMQRPEESYFDMAFARRVALRKQTPALHSRRFAASRPRSADFIVQRRRSFAKDSDFHSLVSVFLIDIHGQVAKVLDQLFQVLGLDLS